MAKKQYGSPEQYEKKLEKVMERFSVTDYEYNWDRHGGWVEFRYKGNLYRFEHSVQKAKERGTDLQYGSDAFAQLVLSLEDLARMVERGIYDLQNWIAGMMFLPPVIEVPQCFQDLGFTTVPSDATEINERYRQLAKKAHPDGGGSEQAFKRLQETTERALQFLENKR